MALPCGYRSHRGITARWVTNFEAEQKASKPAGVFYTPAQVAELLPISPKSVIARFSGMAGVLTLSDDKQRGRVTAKADVDYRKRPRESYRQIRVPKHVLDRFIETNTNQASTTLSIARNRKKV